MSEKKIDAGTISVLEILLTALTGLQIDPHRIAPIFLTKNLLKFSSEKIL